jgi:hypothetical protein
MDAGFSAPPALWPVVAGGVLLLLLVGLAVALLVTRGSGPRDREE